MRLSARRRLALAALLVGLAAVAVSLQTQSENPDRALRQTREIYEREGPRAAFPGFKNALTGFRERGDRRGEAITLRYLGNCHKHFGDFQRALEYLTRALAMARELGERSVEARSLSNLGLLYWEMGDYQEATEPLKSSITIAREIGNRKLEGSALNNLGLVYDELGDYGQSLGGYHEALESYSGVDFPKGESDTLGNIGGAYLLRGQYRQAMEYYQRAFAISEREGLKPTMSQDLGNLGLCQLGLGQVDEAQKSFDRALLLAREAGLKQDEAYWLRAKANGLLRFGQYDSALQGFRQALQMYQQAGAKGELIGALNEIGTLHVLLGDAASGEDYFRRGLELAREGGQDRGVTLHLMALGDLEWRRQRYQEAAALYREALARAREADERSSVAESLIRLALTHREQGLLEQAMDEAREALTVAQAIEARLLQARALYALGEIERLQGHLVRALERYSAAGQTVEPVGDPDLLWRVKYGQGKAHDGLDQKGEAIAALEQSVAVIETVRNRLREERFRAGYIEDKYQVYVELVRLLLELGRIEEAFASAERLRARSHQELLNRGLPPLKSAEQRRAEIEHRAKIRQLQTALEEESAKPDPELRTRALEFFRRELIAAKRSYQDWLDDLRHQDPGFADAQALSAPSPRQVQRMLPAAGALVEYVIADDRVVVFVLTADRLRATTVPLRRADLEAKVELLRDLLLRIGSGAWRTPAASLAESLIVPAEEKGWLDGIEKLYLVPHGVLHYVPFAALPRTAGEGARLLIEDYELAYLPSAADLVDGRPPAGPSGTLLALAPRRSRLRYAADEAQSIAEIFPQPRSLLIGDLATESSFRGLAGRFRVLHLATHGYFNKLNPLLSGLELEPSGADNGRLEVHEILGLRLEADLVTLSACETALGSGYFAEVPAGDDFVGLTRAFLFAGSASVVASLWEVDDRSTSRLMQSFYGLLGQGDKARALALAQRRLLRAGGRYAHPYFWAPFVLVGKISSEPARKN